VLEFRYDRDVERAHGLPKASRQVPFKKPDGSRGFRDRCYEKYGLVVELDGKLAHPAERRGHDRRRDNDAAAGGGTTLRYDWDDVTRHGCATAAQVARSLAKRGWTGRLRPCSPPCPAVPHKAPSASKGLAASSTSKALPTAKALPTGKAPPASKVTAASTGSASQAVSASSTSKVVPASKVMAASTGSAGQAPPASKGLAASTGSASMLAARAVPGSPVPCEVA
jgi:very-short-patch-repair endonuclease